MGIFNKQSLENLRSRVDLVEVISSYVEFKRTGAVYKGLCPFHDEKSPSFIVRKGDSHYHCFGCSAHGDAIQFLMTHQKLSFTEAVENLAQRFHVPLEIVESEERGEKGPAPALLKKALAMAEEFYRFYLLHTPAGRPASEYLLRRGIDREFIDRFKIGLAPERPGMLLKIARSKGFDDEVLAAAGLISKTQDGKIRDFFSDRIVFPIHAHTGETIGFSGRKYKEATYGGKYVNSPETVLFKKSRLLYGLNYSRRRIAKERKAIIVEGQIDALRLIHAGFNITVAGQGTAFGEGHVKELGKLGINRVFLALDSDSAGQEATFKIGHLFQKEGVESRIVRMPPGEDPDLFLRKNGPDAFVPLLESSSDYLSFLIDYLARDLNLDSPAGKNELVQKAAKQIQEWNHPVMIHETLRKLAHAMNLPENYVGTGRERAPNVYIKRSASIGSYTVDPDRILETDLLRWLLLHGEASPESVRLVKTNLKNDDFRVPVCRKIFEIYLCNSEAGRPCDFLSLAIDLEDAEGEQILSELLQKKINREKCEEQVLDTIQKIMDRNWMQKREEIKMRIQAGRCSEEEVLQLVKEFDESKRRTLIPESV